MSGEQNGNKSSAIQPSVNKIMHIGLLLPWVEETAESVKRCYSGIWEQEQESSTNSETGVTAGMAPRRQEHCLLTGMCRTVITPRGA